MALAAPPLRMIGLLLLALLLWLQYRLWLGDAGLPAAHGLQLRVEAQREENLGLAQRNAVLAAEVDNLKAGEAAVEERARTELGMIRPGETFYRVVESRLAESRSVEGASADDASMPPALSPLPIDDASVDQAADRAVDQAVDQAVESPSAQ